MKGRVYDVTTGGDLGETPDIEATFLQAVRRTAAEGPCYVVLGRGTPAGFLEKLDALGVPWIEEPRLAEEALILSGVPEEWPELRASLGPSS